MKLWLHVMHKHSFFKWLYENDNDVMCVSAASIENLKWKQIKCQCSGISLLTTIDGLITIQFKMILIRSYISGFLKEYYLMKIKIYRHKQETFFQGRINNIYILILWIRSLKKSKHNRSITFHKSFFLGCMVADSRKDQFHFLFFLFLKSFLKLLKIFITQLRLLKCVL